METLMLTSPANRATSAADQLDADARILLELIAAYAPAPGPQTPLDGWLKEYVLGVIVHEGVLQGLFERYTLAPSLFRFRGFERYALIAQAVATDLARLSSAGFVEKMILSTWYYAPIEAVRLTQKGADYLQAQPSASVSADVDRLIRCGKNGCRQLMEYAVAIFEQSPPAATQSGHSSIRVFKVCQCQVGSSYHLTDSWLASLKGGGHAKAAGAPKEIETFFSIGDVAYLAKPFFGAPLS